MNALEPILAQTRTEVARRRASLPADRLGERDGELRGFARALAAPGLSLIAEHKRRSPSAGAIRDGLAIEEVVTAYERGGARALSVLTDGPSFGGSLDDLRAARAATALPVLRKDFIVDEYQLHESFAAGADAILLIVAAHDRSRLSDLHSVALELGLDALVEVHDERELEVAVAIGASVIGINNRDLTTLAVDVERTHQLLPGVPSGATVVAESGLRDREQLDRLAAAGVDAVLMGETLMRAEDPEAACRALTGSYDCPR
jgi:indole-3-glycerol phosphate synthase